MKTPTLLARLCAAAVLIAPLSLLGATNDHIVRELKLTKYVEPEFPSMARYGGVGEGQVSLIVSRTPQGEPVDVLVLSTTNASMAEAAVEAARQWRFQPTTDPAELVTKTVRIGFKVMGVLVIPCGKNHHEEWVAESLASKILEPVKVPALQELAQPPKALAQSMPAYPAKLADRKIPGSASVKFYVDEEGRVRLPQVIEASAPEFADAALAAVAKWRYEAPQIHGRRIVASDNWAFDFKAEN